MKKAVTCFLNFSPDPLPEAPDLRVGGVAWPEDTSPFAVCSRAVLVRPCLEPGAPGVYLPPGARVPRDLLAGARDVRPLVDAYLVGPHFPDGTVRVGEWQVGAGLIGGYFSDGLFLASRYFTVEPYVLFTSTGTEVVWHRAPWWNPDWPLGRDVSAELGVVFPEGSP